MGAPRFVGIGKDDIAVMTRAVDIPAATRAAVEAADAAGTLVPLTTSVHTIRDGGIDFVVRVAEAWQRKPAAGSAAVTGTSSPFLPPYEPGLHVGDLSATHVLLLNKYPVLPGHLLIVTREYASQTATLSRDDFVALLQVLAAVDDGLVFYNGGREAGASQSHRHLQMVSLPLGPGAEHLPVRPWLAAAVPDAGVGSNPALPFPHAIARMPTEWTREPTRHAPALQALYAELWASLGEEADGAQQPAPFNLLATREWIWLVPRSREGVDGLGVNALGFAGCLLAGDTERFARLQQVGPLEVLRRVSGYGRGDGRQRPRAGT